MIESGVVTGIQTSGIRGKIGNAVSNGKLKGIAVLRSHGGRVRPSDPLVVGLLG
jgi:citrate lyase subunit alpha/citrate CoA-transferase